MSFCCLICVHNGEDYLLDQIESILRQLDDDSFLFIHDWNSSDSSERIASSYCSLNSNVSFKKWNTAPGPCESFLKSLSYIRDNYSFDYIFLSDQDDIWFPNRVSVYKKLMNKDYSLICSNAISFNNNHLSGIHTCVNPSLFFNLKHRSKLDYSIYFSNPIIGMTLCLSKEILFYIKDINYKKIIMHDWFLCCLSFHYGKIFYIDQPTVYYRQHIDNYLGVTGNNLFKKFFLLPKYCKNLLVQEEYFYEYFNVRPPCLLKKISIVLQSSFLTKYGMLTLIFLLIISRLIYFK